ncbi:MAG: chloride channel protein [Methyloprofundus sp.]|nr:chloride channel protein [Methyloprofundus sp.]
MKDYRKSFFSFTSWRRRFVFWVGAILIGLLISSMTLLSEWAGQTYRSISLAYPWFNFIIAPFGLALTAWISTRFFPGSQGSGIPQVKLALELNNSENHSHLVSLRIAAGKTFLPIMGLLSGASVGFGGPATHVGASLMASLEKLIKFPTHYTTKGLLLAGSAAGFAAMFSAPLAGIMFGIEEMGRTLDERISSLVLTAIILSGVTAYSILNHTFFFTDELLVLPWGTQWLAIPFCGIIGGFLGGVFSKIIVQGQHRIRKLNQPVVLIAFICGLFIAALGYLSNGESFGTGYQLTRNIIQNDAAIDPLFPLYKMLATCATFFSGIPSGIFVPAIATGAGLGANLADWFPIAPTSIMILLTVTAYFSGMLQSPFTAFVIVLEMTHSHEISIPIMAAAFLATGTSALINPKPLYRALCDNYPIQNKKTSNED